MPDIAARACHIILIFSCSNPIACNYLHRPELVNIAITLNEKTISNLNAVEYQWVRTMYVEGYGEKEINHYIRTCFGGDLVFADLFRKVALHQESIYVLMQYLGCAPSNREF